MPQAYLREVAGGATWDQVSWCQVEPSRGRWDWSRVDNAVRRANALGYAMVLKIRVGTCWATGGTASFRRRGNGVTESRLPTDLSAYQSFVRAVVSRYARMGVHQYAVENEPNAKNFWAGTVDQLVTLTRAAAQAIRAADPKARVVSWGVASEPYGVGVVSRLLAGGRASAAISAYDTYFAHRGTYPPVTSEAALRGFLASARPRRDLAYLRAEQRLLAGHVFDVRQVHFYETWQSVPTLMAYLHATTPHGVPIEVWEAGQYWHGAPSDTGVRSDQAIKTLALLLAGGARRVIWLPLAVEPGSTELRFGLVAADGRPRALTAAYGRLVRWASHTSGKPVAVGGGRGVALPHGSTTRLVVWDDDGARVTRPEDEKGRAWGLAGHAVHWPASGLRLGAKPVFVKLDAAPSRAVSLFLR